MGRKSIETSYKENHETIMKQSIILLFIVFMPLGIIGQKVKTTLNAYGHFDFMTVVEDDSVYSDFKLGEQELFLNAKFNNDFSFLSEITFNYASHGMYRLNIERLRLKYNYFGNHSAIIGKFHTPVNYWNDAYFHARLFFPTIDRPMVFSKWIPVHTFGARMQGQNLGKYNFGYDFLVGGGMSSEDVFKLHNELSITAAVHLKPIDGMRIGVSYYNTSTEDASSMAAHSHSGHEPDSTVYKGPLHFQLFNSSIAYFGERVEVLNEFSYNRTKTDSLGVANSFSNYLYFGYRIKEKNVPFVAYDILYAGENDLHTYPFDRMKCILGYKYEFSNNLNVKLQAEYYRNLHNNHNHDLATMFEFKIQLSYGL